MKAYYTYSGNVSRIEIGVLKFIERVIVGIRKTILPHFEEVFTKGKAYSLRVLSAITDMSHAMRYRIITQIQESKENQ